MKNIIFIVLGVAYFIAFFYYKDSVVFKELVGGLTYGNEILSYFNSIVGMILSLGIIGIFTNYLDDFLIKLFSKTANKYDDILGEFIIKLIDVVKYILAIYIGIHLAIIPAGIQSLVDKVFDVSFIFAVIIMLNLFFNAVLKALLQNPRLTKLSKQVFPILDKILVVILWIIGLITIMSALGYDVKALITGAGIGGLAIALAAQKTVANIFGAISVIINKPFKIGDYITINAHTGVVKDIGLTYLTLRDRTGHRVLIPNDSIVSTSIENHSIRDFRMSTIGIGLEYGTTLTSMKKGVKIVEDILQGYVEDLSIENYRVNFDSFGDFSLNINVTYFSLVEDYTPFLKQKEEINLQIKTLFQKGKLDMAFPTQELIIKK